MRQTLNLSGRLWQNALNTAWDLTDSKLLLLTEWTRNADTEGIARQVNAM